MEMSQSLFIALLETEVIHVPNHLNLNCICINLRSSPATFR